jgi:hypothetical protein
MKMWRLLTLIVIAEQPEGFLGQATRGAILVAPAAVHWEMGNAMSAMFKRRAIGIKAEICHLLNFTCLLRETQSTRHVW